VEKYIVEEQKNREDSKILEINEQRTLRLEVLISALDRPKQSTLGSALLLLLFPIDLPEYH